MALIHCRECGKEISDKAPTCPYCGCPSEDAGKQIEVQKINSDTLRKTNAFKAGIAFGLFVFFPCWLMYGIGLAALYGLTTLSIIFFLVMAANYYKIKHWKNYQRSNHQ